MCNPLAIVAAVVGAAGVGASYYMGQKSLKAQKEAQAQALQQQKQTDQRAEEANNRANQKKPNVAAALSAAELAARSGPSSTMLTGPGGVDTSSLLLGKTSLLGG